MSETCSSQDCDNKAATGRERCWKCIKRRQRKGRPVKQPHTHRGEYGLDPFKLAFESALDMVDLKATDDAGWRKARERFRWALRVHSEKGSAKKVLALLSSVKRIKRQLEALLDSYTPTQRRKTG